MSLIIFYIPDIKLKITQKYIHHVYIQLCNAHMNFLLVFSSKVRE